MKSNFIPMGFGLCKCHACRKVWVGKQKHHKHSERSNKYHLIIKRMRRMKHNEELERRTFNVGSYTD